MIIERRNNIWLKKCILQKIATTEEQMNDMLWIDEK